MGAPPPAAKGGGKPGAPGGGKGGKLGPPPPAGARAPVPSWKAASAALKPRVKLPDASENKRVLSAFKELEAHWVGVDGGEGYDVDWSLGVRDLAVIKGSLEIDESLTGILLAQVGAKIVGLRQICQGRQPCPAREYFAVVLGRRLFGKRLLANWRVVHRSSEGGEFEQAGRELRRCVEQKFGLTGLVEVEWLIDRDAWAARHGGFCDWSHDILRGLGAFFHDAEPSFTAVLELVPGLEVLQDGMTLRDEISINTALGNKPEDRERLVAVGEQPAYVRRQHGTALYRAHQRGDEMAVRRMVHELGFLTAFDALCNNWDRMGLRLLWDNRGNLTNVCVDALDSQRIVGMDQAVHPIDDGKGLEVYHGRLGNLVRICCGRDGEGAKEEIAALDGARSDKDALIEGYYREETAREAKEQDQIMGRAPQHDGLGGGTATGGQTIMGLGEALEDLAKGFYNSTGVLLELSFLLDHALLGGMREGFERVKQVCSGDGDGDKLEGMVVGIADETRRAFANTNDKVVDLDRSVARCVEFVRGNIQVVLGAL